MAELDLAQGDLRGLLSDWAEENKARKRDDRFRVLASVVVALLAAILASVNLCADNTIEDMTHGNFVAADLLTVALAEDDIKDRLTFDAALSPAQRQHEQERIAALTGMAREFDPSIGANVAIGDLLREASRYHRAREVALTREKNFDFAQIALEISILLASISIIALSRWLLTLATFGGATGAALFANGFALWVILPSA